MADTKISALTAATTPLAGTEVLPIVQSGVTKQVSVADLTAGRAVSALSLSLTNALTAANGGTGQSSYTIGDLLYASGATALSKLADVATGNALISGGVGVAPSWGKIGLTTHISGTLAVGNGGTGTATAFTAGSVVFAGASGVYTQDNANFFYDGTNHRLGLGTTSPNVFLHIQGTPNTDGSIAYVQQLTSTGAYNASPAAGVMTSLKYTSGGSYAGMGGWTIGKANTTDGDLGSFFAIHTRGTGGGSSIAEAMRANPSGGVSIGNTTDPGAGSLNVNGSLKVGTTTSVASSGNFQVVQSLQSNAVISSDATNASFDYNNVYINCSRAASANYSFIRGTSGGYADTEFYIRGDGNAYADGTWNNNGADYAEYFESANGQALTLGATVVLDGNKVREATSQDPASSIMGVVRPKEPSKASMVVGNTAWNKWANKYLTDDFDRYIMEDHDVLEWTDADGKFHSYESYAIPTCVVVPRDAIRKTHDSNGKKFQHYKINSQWNPDAEYINRENRPEWNIIGLVGQVKVLKGQPINDRWIKMRDVSVTVEEWMIR